MWFEFITNTDCNWNCSYCSFDRADRAQMSIEKINRHSYVFDIIKKLEDVEESTIVFLGGEIGLIKDNGVLLELFKKFDKKVIVNTNGEFFKDDRDELYPYIEKFFYHVVPDTKTKKEIEKVSVPVPVVYGIVDDDEKLLKEFVELNKHINISYAAAEHGKFNQELYNKTAVERKACTDLNPFASIDLSREVLCMCTTRGCHVTIPLTEENFIKVLTEYNVFGENDMCNTCYRTCKSTPSSSVKQRKKAFKNVLGI